MTSFLAALEFLTRLRVRPTPRGDMRAVAAAQAWFPAVGLVIGALLLAFDRVASRALPDPAVDVLLVAALAAITGALHLDGLADAADGLLGGHLRESRLEVMRDVHAGTYAIVAVAGVLALKWAGLAALPRDVRFETLLLVPCLARFSMVLTAAAFPYARSEGVGASFHDLAGRTVRLVGGATAVAAAVFLFGVGGLYLAAAAMVWAFAAGSYARRMVGGMTGDLYGATIEIGEALLLLFIAAMGNRGWLDAWALR